MIVCGLPACARSISGILIGARPSLTIVVRIWSTCRKPAAETLPAASRTITTPHSSARLSRLRPTCGTCSSGFTPGPRRRRAARRASRRRGARDPRAGGGRSRRPRAGSAPATRPRPTRRARGGRRRSGPNSTAGTPGLEERDGVGRAVAAHAQRLAARQPRGDVAERHHVRVRARHVGGLADERARDLDVRDRADLREDVTGILVGQVADVDDHGALVRDLVQRVPAVDPAEVDRRPVEQLGGLARERQGLDSAEHIDGLQHRVVAEPRGRAVGGAAADDDPAGEHALGLDADVQLGRLAGDREVADEALAHHLVRRAHMSRSSDSSSGAHRKRTRTRASALTSCSAHIIEASAPFMS